MYLILQSVMLISYLLITHILIDSIYDLKLYCQIFELFANRINLTILYNIDIDGL